MIGDGYTNAVNEAVENNKNVVLLFCSEYPDTVCAFNPDNKGYELFKCICKNASGL